MNQMSQSSSSSMLVRKLTSWATSWISSYWVYVILITRGGSLDYLCYFGFDCKFVDCLRGDGDISVSPSVYTPGDDMSTRESRRAPVYVLSLRVLICCRGMPVPMTSGIALLFPGPPVLLRSIRISPLLSSPCGFPAALAPSLFFI